MACPNIPFISVLVRSALYKETNILSSSSFYYYVFFFFFTFIYIFIQLHLLTLTLLFLGERPLVVITVYRTLKNLEPLKLKCYIK